MKPRTTSQAPSKAGSAKQSTNTGSGSRPGGGKYPIESSAPKSPQRVRG